MKKLLIVVPLLSLGCAAVNELPTQNEEAYSLYLEGNEIFRSSTNNIRGPVRAYYQGLGDYARAAEHSEGAVENARRAMEIMPTSRDTLVGPRVHVDVIVRVFALAGDADAAIEAPSNYLDAPGEWSIEGLLPDPRLDAIREDPGFQSLVEKYQRPVEG